MDNIVSGPSCGASQSLWQTGLYSRSSLLLQPYKTYCTTFTPPSLSPNLPNTPEREREKENFHAKLQENNSCHLLTLHNLSKKTNHRAPSSPYTTPSSSPPRDHEPAYTSDVGSSSSTTASDAVPPSAALKLEELLPLGVLNKLSPGNLKRATDEFLTEWEKSLAGEQAVEVKDKAC